VLCNLTEIQPNGDAGPARNAFKQHPAHQAGPLYRGEGPPRPLETCSLPSYASCLNQRYDNLARYCLKQDPVATLDAYHKPTLCGACRLDLRDVTLKGPQ
jgi:hypothetical protein